jgi:hypothetical protein
MILSNLMYRKTQTNQMFLLTQTNQMFLLTQTNQMYRKILMFLLIQKTPKIR